MQFDPDDLRVDLIRVVGDGSCAVRLVHVPTGRSVTVADHPTIAENRDRALVLLAEQMDSGNA